MMKRCSSSLSVVTRSLLDVVKTAQQQQLISEVLRLVESLLLIMHWFSLEMTSDLMVVRSDDSKNDKNFDELNETFNTSNDIVHPEVVEKKIEKIKESTDDIKKTMSILEVTCIL